MALHGRTKIELRDVNTGRVETMEKSNFITNAVAEYNRPVGGLTDAYGLLSGAHITDYFGGLCLFDKTLEGDENTFFPQGGAAQVGAAEYGVANTTQDTWLGSYNANESNVDYDARTATFVYDFTTAQANGNIGAVCLAPAGCGTGGVWGVRGGSAYNVQNTSYIGSNDMQGHYVYLRPYTSQYNSTSNRIVPICWDIENDTGYYVNETVQPRKLEKRKLYLQTASLFKDQKNTNTSLLEETALGVGVSCNFYTTGYDLYDATHFCVYGYSETGSTAGAYAGKLYCFVFGFDGALYKTITIESPCKKTRVENMQLAYLKGYVLIAGNATEEDGTVPVYRVPESNPTDIQPAKVGEMAENVQRYFKLSMGETYYCCPDGYDIYTKNVPRVFAYNVVANRITRVNMALPVVQNNNTYADAAYKQIPILGHPFTFLHQSKEDYREISQNTWLYRMRVFLSTINNLDEPVTKTADKTMKITYTITEVAE